MDLHASQVGQDFLITQQALLNKEDTRLLLGACG